MKNKNKQLVVEIVLDGWGLSPIKEGNAIQSADTPVMDELEKSYPFAPITASSLDVGLPWGEMGNSEVGHTNLGIGQILSQHLYRISLSIEDDSFFSNKALVGACEHAKKNKSDLHVMGLASNGGVHSHIEHLEMIMKICKQQGVKNVYIHMFTDGRDTPPSIAMNFAQSLIEDIRIWGFGEIASIMGRYYAMDRDNNWNRIEKAYRCLTEGTGKYADYIVEAIKNSYSKLILDEKIEPTNIVGHDGKPVGLIRDGDSVIFFNFREDRAREITKAFIQEDFDKFKRKKLENLYFASMTEYEKNLPTHIAFPPQEITTPLGKVLADNGLTQLRIAETEKYAHVTYFFNGGIEEPFKGEDRKMIPSKKVKSYSENPEMSANEIAEEVVKQIESDNYNFILVNFANADMVGHTGNFKAGIKAVETADKNLGKVVDAVLKKGGITLVTADHGNAEYMIDSRSHTIVKEHSANPVPLILVNQSKLRERTDQEVFDIKFRKKTIGRLSDVTVTILDIFDLPVPKEMTGKSLLDKFY